MEAANDRDALECIGAARALVDVEPEERPCVLRRAVAGVQARATHACDEQDVAERLLADALGFRAAPHALDRGERLGEPGRPESQGLAQRRLARRLVHRPRGGGGDGDWNRVGVTVKRGCADTRPGLPRALDVGVEAALGGQQHRAVGEAP